MKKIRSKREYKKLLFRAEQLIDLDPKINSDKGKELNKLVDVIMVYEQKHYMGWMNDSRRSK